MMIIFDLIYFEMVLDDLEDKVMGVNVDEVSVGEHICHWQTDPQPVTGKCHQ